MILKNQEILKFLVIYSIEAYVPHSKPILKNESCLHCPYRFKLSNRKQNLTKLTRTAYKNEINMHTDFELTSLLPLHTSFVLFTHCFYAVIYALVKKLFVLVSLHNLCNEWKHLRSTCNCNLNCNLSTSSTSPSIPFNSLSLSLSVPLSEHPKIKIKIYNKPNVLSSTSYIYGFVGETTPYL